MAKYNNIIDNSGINNQDPEEDLDQFNPLVEPLPWWYGFYERIRLVPWWLRYNIGIAEQADLRDKIIIQLSRNTNDSIIIPSYTIFGPFIKPSFLFWNPMDRLRTCEYCPFLIEKFFRLNQLTRFQ